ncbi:hypothetical protein OH76DRAFT_1409985 [Lentinus brumalis]|uniref:Uncharacterized protein n=1 Tax=Lentinus brumalis TaxID=2498619 RepID=A0A371CTK7_9APHY|nr:hypothetical protein OH76DRAFT_1409985 [Polyporus brumalis]
MPTRPCSGDWGLTVLRPTSRDARRATRSEFDDLPRRGRSESERELDIRRWCGRRRPSCVV